MIVAEFVLVAFVAGILAKSVWVAIVTFALLYSVYRYSRLSVLLAALLIAYWAAVGFQVGRSVRGPVGALAGAVVAGLVAARVHRDAFTRLRGRGESTRTSAPQPAAFSASPVPQIHREGDVIDVEYRVVS